MNDLPKREPKFVFGLEPKDDGSAERLSLLQAAVDRYLQNPGCNNGSRVTAFAKLQWALDESRKEQ